MGMWTTDNQEIMNEVLTAFSKAARANYGSHAFEAGYLQSVITSLIPLLSKRHQRVLIDDMVRAAQKQEKAVIAKLNENKTMESV